MKYTLEATNCIDSKDCSISLDDEQITECPSCHKSFAPNPLFACVYKYNGHYARASVVFFCRDCSSVFFAHYTVSNPSIDYRSIEYTSSSFISVEPVKFVPTAFDKNITNLSPQFVKIYNQALAAETTQLDEIAGLGYRKALEFLIKDFAIHQYPTEEEQIKAMSLSTCIKNYIDAPNIKTLATRSAWIGNDEAHYIRKQEDRDINDMKNFIKATVYFIGMILIVEDAASMEPK